MDYYKLKHTLLKKGISGEKRDILYGYNRIRFHNRYETLPHFLTKALLGFLIFKKSDGMISEFELKTGEIADIFQTKKNGELIFYEIESLKEKPKTYAQVTIKLKDMPKEVKDGLIAFKKWIEKYIV